MYVIMYLFFCKVVFCVLQMDRDLFLSTWKAALIFTGLFALEIFGDLIISKKTSPCIASRNVSISISTYYLPLKIQKITSDVAHRV